MLSTLWHFMPAAAKRIGSVVLFVVFAGMWLFVGNTSSVYTEFKAITDVEGQKKRLPESYLPLQPGSELYGVKEVENKKAFMTGTKTVVSYFTMPYLESSVCDFYHKQLKQEGWDITSDKHDDQGTTIEVKKGECSGSVHIVHLDAGSELELSLSKIDATVQ